MAVTDNKTGERAACLLLLPHLSLCFFLIVFLSLCLCVCVGGQQLAVSDADTAPDELEFELVEPPVHGELLKTDGGSHTSMTNGETKLPSIFCFVFFPRSDHQRKRKGLSSVVFVFVHNMSETFQIRF